jgi:DNA-binding CsgD family transcriptional regulator
MVLLDPIESAFSVEDFVAEIVALKTQFDVFRAMKRLTEAYGCRAFMVMNLPARTSLDLQSNSIINNWPTELLSIYDQEGLLPNDAIIRRIRGSTLPFFRDEVRENVGRRDDGKSQLVTALFQRFQMSRSAFFPTHDASGARGIVLFSGEREPFAHKEITDLSFISIYVFDRLAEIRNLDARVSEMLNDREIDCLTWTAAGKTSADIAEILGLSEHTVNHYLNKATKKLDTVNRTQAVAKALRVGLIK